jgi:hypothetical protein
MSADTKNAIQKIQIVAELSANNDVKSLCNILIDYLKDTTKSEMGFARETKE